MHINQEAREKHSVQAYSDSEIKINEIHYSHNLIICREEVMTDWPIKIIDDLDETHLSPLLVHQPEIIIIGHSQLGKFAPMSIRQTLSKERIGLETMSIGAACRTFNILLGEHRRVVLGIIF